MENKISNSTIPINSKDVINFIEDQLINNLKADSKKHLLLKEQDLQYRTYFHIQRFFERNNNYIWRTLNMPYLSKVQKIPDILILEYSKPKFVFEIKDSIVTKKTIKEILVDFDKLDSYQDEYQNIQKCYFLGIFDWDDKSFLKLKDKIKEKNVQISNKVEFFLFNVNTYLSPSQYDNWINHRDRYIEFE